MSRYNLYFFLILLIFYPRIKPERWWSIITDYDTRDDDEGFSGSTHTPCIDFYLCGKRNYKVHYKDDPPDIWSKNFSNCEPVGNGREIDGICIYGGKSYRGQLFQGIHWMPVKKGCNTSDVNKYVGELGTSLACIAINGKDEYRMAYIDNMDTIKSSNPKNLGDRIIKSFFGNKVKNYTDYDREYELDLSVDINNRNKINYFNATIQLLKTEELNLNGDEIKFTIYSEDYIFKNWDGKEINKLMIKKLKKIINFDYFEEIQNFEKIIQEVTMHGVFAIHSYYEENRIQMDIASKIVEDVEGFRGGIRLNLILKNSEKLLELIKKVLKLISGYINIEKRNEVLNRLKEFREIKELKGIIELISPYNIMFNQIIFLYLIKS